VSVAAPPEPDGGIGPVPEGGYPVREAPTDPGSTPERWRWTALVAGIGALIFALMVFGGFGGVRPELQQVQVADVLTSAQRPVDRFGSNEIRIVGWYAQISTGCSGSTAGGTVTWLAAECPLRVLLTEQPSGTPSQAELTRIGLRLAAPNGKPFPPPIAPGSGTAGLEPLVFDGHFDDAAAASCSVEARERCRSTFVVTGYTGLIR
jgi:hypothetical protein